MTTWAGAPEPTRSDSHAWSAHPNYDLLTIVAGIRPKAAGFSSVTIVPHLGGLKRVEAAMPHPKGMIAADYTATTAQITLPAGVSGELIWKGSAMPLHEGSQSVSLH